MGKVYTRFQTKTSQKPYPICVVRVAGGLEVAGGRENGRARGRHACLLLSRAFFLVATISKRLLRRLDMRWGGTYLYSWSSKLKRLLNLAGLGDIWSAKTNTPAIMNYIRQRLLDIEQQTWISEIHNDERKDPHQKKTKNF